MSKISAFFKKPWERGNDAKATKRDSGFKKPWERDSEDRSFGSKRDGGFKRDRFGAGKRDSGFKKPWERDGEDRGFGSKRDGGFKKPWERDGEDRGFGGKRDGGFKRDRFGGGKRDGGFKKPWERDGEDRGFGAEKRERGGFKRDSFGGKRDGGFKKPWERDGEDRGFGAEKRERGENFKRKSFDAVEEAPAKKQDFVPARPEGELLFGRQPVIEMLRANRRQVLNMIFADGVKDSDEVDEIRKACEEREIRILKHKRETLDAWMNSANHQGVVAVCADYPYVDIDELYAEAEKEEENQLFVILDHVVDPQNLGSIIRSCECAGAKGIVLPADRAVGVTPAAVRASAGAAEHIRIALVPNISEVIERLKKYNVWSTGLEALPESKNYTDINFKGKVCIVIGSEGQGLGRLVRERCDNLARLPMFGKVGSLNAGVAGALAIYEVIRQQNAQ
jgi:23S rRNA (guanosine2251-2'-O)-methyltransferase